MGLEPEKPAPIIVVSTALESTMMGLWFFDRMGEKALSLGLHETYFLPKAISTASK